ncbi:MAG: LysR family transcriptional regulator [Alphaproteobacteria bacterium]|nr:LysR family transcriptional regulator [Alphaproteobacteria bacterium]MCW5742687.1 LysR family transcriptional regulator [Alphaproteobacteria bacterium]
MQDWDDLRYALAIARTGTLSGAARRLRVHETTVARRLAAVEARLGTRLFERIGGGLRPTSAGAIAIARAGRIERDVVAAQAAISGADTEVAGIVRLTAVPILANRVLVPTVASLHRAHPRLRLELIAEPRDVSLTGRDADIALRLARPRGHSAVRTRRVGRLDYAAYAARDFPPEWLPWIGYEDAMGGLPQAKWLSAAMRRSRRRSPLAINDAEGLLQAVCAGLGKSLLPCAIADREPRLRRIGKTPVLSRELWLLVHADMRPLARIAAVIEWAERTLRAAGISVR